MRAGLDVYADEPGSSHGSWDSAVAKHPNVVGTHHIGASTNQAQRAIAAGVVEIVDAFVAGEARHCVNLAPHRLGSMTLTIRHLDRVGVLARVLDILSGAHLNVEHMVNRVFRGGDAAVASIDIEGHASDGAAGRAAGDRARAGGHGRPPGREARREHRPAVPGARRPPRVGPQDGLRAVGLRRRVGHRPLPGRAWTPTRTPTPPSRCTSTARRSSGTAYAGVVCEIAVQAVADGRVRGHEAVHPQRVDALVWHHNTTDGPPALVELLHRAGPTYTPHARGGAADRAAAGLRRPPRHPADRVAAAGGRRDQRPRRGAGRRRLLHRRRPSPLRGRARGVVGGGQARGRRPALRRAPDGRPAPGLLPPPRPRPGRSSDEHARGRCSREDFQVRATTGAGRMRAAPRAGSMGLYVGRRWFEITYDRSRPRDSGR